MLQGYRWWNIVNMEHLNKHENGLEIYKILDSKLNPNTVNLKTDTKNHTK